MDRIRNDGVFYEIAYAESLMPATRKNVRLAKYVGSKDRKKRAYFSQNPEFCQPICVAAPGM